METSLPVKSYDNKPTDDIQRTERTTDKPTDGHEGGAKLTTLPMKIISKLKIDNP